MRGSRKFSQGGGGVQIPRRGLTEIFNVAKINNLAIPGWGPDPLSPPLDPPMEPNNFLSSYDSFKVLMLLCVRSLLIPLIYVLNYLSSKILVYES